MLRLPGILCLFILGGCAGGPHASEPAGLCTKAGDQDVSALPDHASGFVWLDPAAGIATCYGRATERRVPASTFKIPHALIALDSGALDDPDAPMIRDAGAYPAEAWWPAEWVQDHTLESALEHSVVWYYREVARLLGPAREKAYLEALDYGNAEIGDNPTSFWLVGPLAVSAEEQALFLRRLWESALPVSEGAQARTRQMVTVLDASEGERILGKTGTARLEDGALNWLTGVVERPQGPAFFALWVESEGWMPPASRLALLKTLRADLP